MRSNIESPKTVGDPKEAVVIDDFNTYTSLAMVYNTATSMTARWGANGADYVKAFQEALAKIDALGLIKDNVIATIELDMLGDENKGPNVAAYSAAMAITRHLRLLTAGRSDGYALSMIDTWLNLNVDVDRASFDKWSARIVKHPMWVAIILYFVLVPYLVVQNDESTAKITSTKQST